jgi:hypothetical protein
VREVVGRGVGGRAAWLAALVLLVSGCAFTQQSRPPESPVPSASPSPSPSPPPLKIASATFHSGEVGIAYAPVTLNATGGTTPYTWSVSAGAMPSGLTISTNGTVEGTPKSAGTFHFTLQVSDAGGSVVTAAKSFGIAKALKATLIPACALRCAVEVGCVNACGKFGSLTGGIGPYTYTSLGNLPAGVRLSGLSLVGTFTTAASATVFTVNVTDSLGAHTSLTPTFYTYPHISLHAGSCSGQASCTTVLTFSGGLPGSLPTARVTVNPVSYGSKAVITVTVQYGQLAIVVGPQPGQGPYTGTLTLVLTDQSICGAGVNCSSAGAALTVNLAGG